MNARFNISIFALCSLLTGCASLRPHGYEVVEALFADTADCKSYHQVRIYKDGIVDYEAYIRIPRGGSVDDRVVSKQRYKILRDELVQLIALIQRYPLRPNLVMPDLEDFPIKYVNTDDPELLKQVHEYLNKTPTLRWFQFSSNSASCEHDLHRLKPNVQIMERPIIYIDGLLRVSSAI